MQKGGCRCRRSGQGHTVRGRYLQDGKKLAQLLSAGEIRQEEVWKTIKNGKTYSGHEDRREKGEFEYSPSLFFVVKQSLHIKINIIVELLIITINVFLLCLFTSYKLNDIFNR